MARPLRIEFAGALYHVTSRGDRREAIFEDDEDREAFLSVLAEVVERYFTEAIFVRIVGDGVRRVWISVLGQGPGSISATVAASYATASGSSLPLHTR
jgi:hypothetical protein